MSELTDKFARLFCRQTYDILGRRPISKTLMPLGEWKDNPDKAEKIRQEDWRKTVEYTVQNILIKNDMVIITREALERFKRYEREHLDP